MRTGGAGFSCCFLKSEDRDAIASKTANPASMHSSEQTRSLRPKEIIICFLGFRRERKKRFRNQRSRQAKAGQLRVTLWLRASQTASSSLKSSWPGGVREVVRRSTTCSPHQRVNDG